jgi:hypothetical protein
MGKVSVVILEVFTYFRSVNANALITNYCNSIVRLLFTNRYCANIVYYNRNNTGFTRNV